MRRGSLRGVVGATHVMLCIGVLSAASSVPIAAAQSVPPTGDGTTAQPNPDQPSVEFEQRDSVARQHFQWGGAAYGRGDFDEAIREFREAHRLSGRPVLLFNLYLAYRDARRDVEARDTLRDYLALVPDAPNRAQLEARLRALESALANPTATPEDAGSAGADQGATATPGDTHGSAGPTAPPREPAEGTSGGALPTLGWIAVSVGAAALIGAIITGVLAQGAASDLEAGCGPMKRCPSTLRATYDDASTLGTITDVLWIGGGVLALGGVSLLLLTLLSGEDESHPPAVLPAAACSATGCSAELRVAF